MASEQNQKKESPAKYDDDDNKPYQSVSKTMDRDKRVAVVVDKILISEEKGKKWKTTTQEGRG